MNYNNDTVYKILGKGKYSIVITPAVKNIDNYRWYFSYRDRHPTDVTKLFIYDDNNIEDFTREFNTLMKISEIDNYKDFTVPFKGASTINTHTLMHDIDLLQKLKAEGIGKVYQIILGYGGINVSKMNEPISYQTYISLIHRFYKGLEVLHKNNIIHRDLKPANVLYDGKQINIVDFGLACPIDEVYDKNSSYFILEDMYMYHPPEFYIAHLIFKEPKELSFNDKIDNVFSNLTTINEQSEHYYYNHLYRYQKSKGYNIELYIECFKNVLTEIKKRNIASLEELFTIDIALKSDIYSSSFILRSLAINVIYTDDDQKKVIEELHDMTYALNPFARSSLTDVLKCLEYHNIS